MLEAAIFQLMSKVNYGEKKTTLPSCKSSLFFSFLQEANISVLKSGKLEQHHEMGQKPYDPNSTNAMNTQA